MASPEQIASYQAKVEAAFGTVKSLVDDPQWKENKKEKDIVFYFRYESGSSFCQVKSIVTIAKPPEVTFNFVKSDRPVNASTPKDQKEGCIERRNLAPVDGDPNESKFYYIVVDANSRLVSNREFLMFQRVFREGDKLFLVRTSVDNEALVPPAKGTVRGNMVFQAFIVEPDPAGSKLTFLCHAEPNGSIPSALYNAAATNQGYSALRFKKALEA
jgi:hypothetical protein